MGSDAAEKKLDNTLDDFIQETGSVGLRKSLLSQPGFGEDGLTAEDGTVDRAAQERSRPIILCFVAYYLPGYRSGGPVRTIANFVDHLGDEFDIRIVTRDRDALDTEPYPDVTVDGWNAVGKAQVFYASARTTTLWGIARLLRETPHDLIYVNSFFAFGFTTLPLLARRLRLAPRKPCVIAPRGEFSAGAVALKAWKKRPYRWVTKRLGLYQSLHWQASSVFEVGDIGREFGVARRKIAVAPNLVPRAGAAETEPQDREPGPLRVVFLSRISPMKNLDYLLRALADVSPYVELSIIGPVEVQAYWDQCRKLIDALPRNVSVQCMGESRPESVSDAFSQHDLFILPTRGENFGHVIYESLAVGTPVLLSDQTPWLADDDGALEVLPLANVRDWSQAIERWSNFDDETLREKRRAALNYVRRRSETQDAVEQNRALFLALAAGGGQQIARNK